MRLAACLGLLLLVPLSCPAAEKPRPNALTPAQATEGWLLLFDGVSPFAWDVRGDCEVNTDGVLVLGGQNPTTAHTTATFGAAEGRFEFSDDGKRWGFAWWSNYRPPGEGKLFTETMVAAEKGLRELLSWDWVERPREVKSGSFGFRIPAGKKLYVRSIAIKPHGLKSIFNGKDLTGWKEFPGKKSRFTVTDKGELNVKDGPGDLQTEGKWDDFVLQLECVSNGKHLNSGIFFRCRPNEYQNGYEAQVRNQFTEKPTQKYLLEEYDPKTHKLLGKKEVMRTAVDFGTGAIYRRQPARKQASKDGEWFTLTVIARGNHFATWVGGVQQVDWTDNRPPSDNARTGYRREAGHISIQGHDPTTDLSFRNLRIAPLPSRK